MRDAIFSSLRSPVEREVALSDRIARERMETRPEHAPMRYIANLDPVLQEMPQLRVVQRVTSQCAPLFRDPDL